MIIEAFEADGFRNLTGLALRPHPSLNLVVGPNGAGKSSVLEAIQCLATGVGFRSRRYRDHLAHEAEEYVLRAELSDPIDGRAHRCGVRRGRDGTLDARLDYEPVSSFADIARVMPVKVLTPDSHLVVQGAPDERRRFLDWGCFHAEEAFLPAWRRYRRALSQRNELLRDGASDREVAAWDEALERDGTRLHELRSRYVFQFARHVKKRAQSVDFQFHVKLDLRSGWSRDLALGDALVRNLELHRRMRTTTDGPHRAELVIRAGDHPARDVLSRGQQKLLVHLMHLAQLDVLAGGTGEGEAGDGEAAGEGATRDRSESDAGSTERGPAPPIEVEAGSSTDRGGRGTPGARARPGPVRRRPIVLCDDLASELDERAARVLLDALVESGSQVFVAGTSLPASLAAAPSGTTLDGTETPDPIRPCAVFELDAGRLLG